jgi:hypothetical protein
MLWADGVLVADNDQLFGQGYLWSSNYPMSGTLDGGPFGIPSGC